jgi:glycosyltransferase involved in cell wall biosynthesis
VRRELERIGVPHRHELLSSREDLARAYREVDVCLVTSRQEGGPKAVLEAMASGVPIVSTRVGQASELIRDGENGLLADVEDVDALADAVKRVHGDADLRARLRAAGRATAEAHAEERLDPLWARLLEGFVRRAG